MKRLKLIIALALTLIYSAWGQNGNLVVTIAGTTYNLAEVVIEQPKVSDVKTFLGDSIALTYGTDYYEGILFKGKDMFAVSDGVLGKSLSQSQFRDDQTCLSLESDFDLITSSLICDAESTSNLVIEQYIISDYEAYLMFGDNIEIRNLTMLNNISLIYRSQLQIPVTFKLIGQLVYRNIEDDPLQNSDGSTPSMNEMINESVNLYSGIDADNIAIWTGKQTSGGVVGVAWKPGLCNTFYSRNVNKIINNSVLETVIYAHEVGHNLGFDHDNVDTDKIMRPFINNTYDFSTQSEGKFNSYLNTSQYDCSRDCTVLPAEIGYFEVTENKIEFETLVEVDVDNFEVMASYDGSSFEGVMKIPANNKPSTYSFPHTFNYKYYQLVTNDIDGTQQYSNIVYVNVENYSLLMYENPLRDFIYNTETIDVEIHSVNGTLVLSSSDFVIDVKSLESGIYFVNGKKVIKL